MSYRRGLCLLLLKLMLMLLFSQVHLQRFVADGRNRGAGNGPDALQLVSLAALADGVVLIAFFLSFPARQTPSFGPDQRFSTAGFRFGARWRAHGRWRGWRAGVGACFSIFPCLSRFFSDFQRIVAQVVHACRPQIWPVDEIPSDYKKHDNGGDESLLLNLIFADTQNPKTTRPRKNHREGTSTSTRRKGKEAPVKKCWHCLLLFKGHRWKGW